MGNSSSSDKRRSGRTKEELLEIYQKCHLKRPDLFTKLIVPVDPYAASMWPSYENQVFSNLVRLPDNVLIEIMNLLEPQEMTKLRYVSRKFMQIFDHYPEFKNYHAKEVCDSLKSSLWAVPDPSTFFPGQCSSALEPFCSNCADVRKSDALGRDLLISMPSLYCSGCKKSHRITHFSQHQREEPSDEERACVGHEAHVRLDQKCSFSWRQAKAISRSPSNRLVNECSSSTAPYSCESKLCTFVSINAASYKELVDKTMEMKLSRVIHLPVERKSNEKICAEALHKCLSGLKNGSIIDSPLDGFLFDPLQVLRAFDRNVCDCVDYRESEISFNSPVARTFAWHAAEAGKLPARQHLHNGFVGKHGRCAGRQHGFSSRYKTGDYDVDIFQCPGNPDMIVVKMRFSTVVETASDPGWRCILDKGSYVFDPKMLGVTWCKEEQSGVSRANRRHQSLYELEQKHNL